MAPEAHHVVAINSLIKMPTEIDQDFLGLDVGIATFPQQGLGIEAPFVGHPGFGIELADIEKLSGIGRR